ncbi:MAG: VanZ family protein [Bacteroidota bacterium]
MRQFFRNTRWAILWGIFIFLLTGIPGSVLPKLPSYIDLFQPDKLAHLFVFAVFFILLIRSFRNPGTPSQVTRNQVFFAFLISMFLAGATELLQEFVIPLRVASIWDFIANLAGCLAGWGIMRVWTRDEGRET